VRWVPFTFLSVLSVTAAQTEADPVPFSEAPVPHQLVRRAHGPITIDGILDEFDWAVAPQINRFHRVTVGSEFGDLDQATRARLLWDDDALYVAFASRDTDIWALFTEEDDPMWSEEVVEVFIDPDGDGLNYLELEVNPLNARVDLHIRALQPTWDSSIEWDIEGVQTAVGIAGTVNDTSDTDTGWIVEMAIPWAAFLPEIVGGGRPEVGDRWRLNLYRIERGAGAQTHSPMIDLWKQMQDVRQEIATAADTTALSARFNELREQMVPLNEVYELASDYSAWSPTLHPGFHRPSRFGIVEFGP
jgi:hypothetical protein